MQFNNLLKNKTLFALANLHFLLLPCLVACQTGNIGILAPSEQDVVKAVIMESTEHRQVFVEPSAFKHFSDSSFQLFHGSMKLIFPYSIGSGCFVICF